MVLTVITCVIRQLVTSTANLTGMELTVRITVIKVAILMVIISVTGRMVQKFVFLTGTALTVRRTVDHQIVIILGNICAIKQLDKRFV
jgi:hypothetical protein